jgi:hypothetical protein
MSKSGFIIWLILDTIIILAIIDLTNLVPGFNYLGKAENWFFPFLKHFLQNIKQ